MNRSLLIFCHYGNTDYLYYTLHAARLSNPDLRIVLLGDAANEKVARRAGIEHCHFTSLETATELMSDFDQSYRHIAGSKHGKEGWLKFVFKRWFYVHAFLQKESITGGFWHFDSDTIILSDLPTHESKFEDYDCTEQCNGSCMNGYVTAVSVLEGYLSTINKLFLDEDYKDKQRIEFERNERFAFTEMRAYKYFKEHQDVKVIKLNTILEGSTFDDAICQEHGLEMQSKKLAGKPIKKVYRSKKGSLFCKKSEDGELVKMNSLNMSWVPTYLYPMFIEKSWLGESEKENLDNGTHDVEEIDVFSASLMMKVRYNLGRVKNYLLIQKKST